MLKLVSFSIALATVGLGKDASADQCKVVPKKQADKAAQVIKTSLTYLVYCEPCGDPTPTNTSPIHVRDAKTGKVDVSVTKAKGGYSVQIKGAALDVGYLFYELRSDKDASGTYFTLYANVAKLVGCAAKGVSDTVKIDNLAAGGMPIKPSVK